MSFLVKKIKLSLFLINAFWGSSQPCISGGKKL